MSVLGPGEVRRRLGHGSAVFARVGGAEVDAALRIVEDGLAAAGQVAVVADDLEIVTAGGEGVADVGGDAVLDQEVAAAPGVLVKRGASRAIWMFMPWSAMLETNCAWACAWFSRP